MEISCQTTSPVRTLLGNEHEELQGIVNLEQYPLHEEEAFASLIRETRQELNANSVITIPNFLTPDAIQSLVQEALENKHKAFYTDPKNTHNVYLTPNDPSKPPTHIYNRQIVSTKGCITTDQIPHNSLLKTLYYNETFQMFLQQVLQVKKLHPYQDPLSSINVHYASEGQELGWHFDNSAFAITLLLQKPDLGGGVFEYVPNIRQADNDGGDNGDGMGFEKVQETVDGRIIPKTLELNPGTLVLFRGRDSLHRVTKVVGDITRILVVFAYNEKAGIELSEEARLTFFGRTGVPVDVIIDQSS